MSDRGTMQTAVMEQCVMASHTDARMKERNFTAGFFPTSKKEITIIFNSFPIV